MIDTTREGPTLIAGLSGRIDGTNARQVQTDLESALGGDDRQLLLDFADLSYISSAGLRVILLVARQLDQKGGQLAVCGLSDSIAEIFKISGFDKIINVHADRPAALADLQG